MWRRRDRGPLILQKEFSFLKNKYSLTPMQLEPKFLRMRPASFPTVRLAQLAVFFKEQSQIMQQIKYINSVKGFYLLFSINTTSYWDTHYRIDKESKFQKKKLECN
jgi:hypothetical protein